MQTQIPTSVITWEDVEPAAKAAFNIWIDQPELKWAKRAWNYFVKYGFANYSNTSEKMQVCFQFLNLCSFYRDWSHIMWDACDAQDDFEWWSLLLGMTWEDISGVVCSEDDFIEGNIRFLSDVVRSVLKARSDEYRAEVVQVLLAGFGDESGLFVSLQQSQFADEGSVNLSSTQLTDQDTIEANLYSDGWKWICDGCTIWPRDCAYDR